MSGDAIVESADALDGLAAALAPYRSAIVHRDAQALRSFDERLAEAVDFLRRNPDFERFDRLTFLATRLQPLAHGFARLQDVLGIGPPSRPRAWSARAASTYDRDAFDAMYFAATDAPPATPALAALGRDLFFDVRLSPSGTRSCATCHVPERAFTDGRSRAELFPGHSARGGGRNTPTLINAGLQPRLFADSRVRTLEDQATDVLGSASEMGGSLHRAADSLRADTAYVSRFAAAFNVVSDTALTARSLRLALAAYDKGGGRGLGFDLAHQTLPADSLHLSREEKAALVAFMKALTDTAGMTGRPAGAKP